MYHTLLKLLFTLFFINTSIYSYSQIQEGIITIDSSDEIKTLIEKKISYNAQIKNQNGYRIQLFYGSETGVRNIRSKFAKLHPNTPTYIDFDTPDWKIRVGNYKTRLEAERALKKIRANFLYAYIMKYKIRI